MRIVHFIIAQVLEEMSPHQSQRHELLKLVESTSKNRTLLSCVLTMIANYAMSSELQMLNNDIHRVFAAANKVPTRPTTLRDRTQDHCVDLDASPFSIETTAGERIGGASTHWEVSCYKVEGNAVTQRLNHDLPGGDRPSGMSN